MNKNLPPYVLVQLRKGLNDTFDEGELKDLCFDIGLDYEALTGQSKREKTRELVNYMRRRGELDKLVTACTTLRPKFLWPRIEEVSEVKQAAAICYRLKDGQIEFLLIRTGGGRWMFPKGGTKPKESLWHTAEREAREEAGVAGKIREQPVATFRHLKRDPKRRGRGRQLVIVGFLLKVETVDAPRESRREPTWFTPEKAQQALAEDREFFFAAELKRVIAEACAAITTKKD